MGVVGSIEITDRVSGVLRNIRREQASFRRDVSETRNELERTWGRTHRARLETGAASGQLSALTGKLKQFGRTVAAPVVKIKDMATNAVGKVTNKIQTVGRAVASPFIRLKDAATSGLKSISDKLKKVGKVFTPIVKLKDATTKGLSAIGGKLKSLGKNVVIPVAVAATVATTAIVTGAVMEGASLEQSIGGVETLFKGDASVVKANADAAFKTAGLSANEYMKQVTSFSASLLGSLGGDTAKAAGVADMAMIDMADNANKFGTDISSIQTAYQGFAKQNYTMLDNLKLGYGGTKEEMARLLKDASKLTGVKYDISNLSDVYNAIHAVQENLGVTGTTAKEAGETFSGSFAAMKASAKNLLGNMAIGGDITGSMESLVESASTFLFNNAVPMIGRVISSLPKVIKTGLKNAAPRIKESGGEIVKNLKAGIISILPSSMGGIVDQVFDSIGNLGSGFEAVLPQLTSFGTTMVNSIQQVASACIPVLTSIITTVQTMLPVILPVIGTVVSTISSLISKAAPVITGLLSAIGGAVEVLGPIFQTIFSEIGEKVGSVIDFVSGKMGFIEEVIGTVAPILGDILSAAWNVISPIMDLAISVFELIFSVVERVFPGVQSILETVWSVVGPIVEGIGSAIGKVADWISSTGAKISASGGSSAVGKNADGDNNWRGGLTWVGEKGPELVNLPRGSKILPNKESVSLASQSQAPATAMVSQISAPVVNNIVSSTPGTASIVRDGVIGHLKEIELSLKAILTGLSTADTLKAPQLQPDGKSPVTRDPNTQGFDKRAQNLIQVTIAKIADTVHIKDESDMDSLAELVAGKVVEVAQNMI